VGYFAKLIVPLPQLDIVWPLRLLHNRKATLIDILGFGRLFRILEVVDARKREENLRHVTMLGASCLFDNRQLTQQ
jgi:hypothetical protein